MEEPNLSYIHSMSGGDAQFEQKLIGIIKKEFPTEKAEFYQNLKNQDYKLTAENVHKLKHKISILGLEKSYELAAAFETNLLDGSTMLKTEFESILTTITDFLAEL